MKLKELKEQAAKILEIPESVGEFSNVSFTCRSGGAPENAAGVTEIHRENTFAYRTTANGDAYSGEVVVLCQATGAFDRRGKEIYKTPEGIVFVCVGGPGSPSSFDWGRLEAPVLS
jgi:hypothetical protein